MRFGIAAGVTALLAMMVAFLPAPVRAQAVDAGEGALEAVASIDDGFAHLHGQLTRKAPSLNPEGDS